MKLSTLINVIPEMECVNLIVLNCFGGIQKKHGWFLKKDLKTSLKHKDVYEEYKNYKVLKIWGFDDFIDIYIIKTQSKKVIKNEYYSN